jgi:hypothetical protein
MVEAKRPQLLRLGSCGSDSWFVAEPQLELKTMAAKEAITYHQDFQLQPFDVFWPPSVSL